MVYVLYPLQHPKAEVMKIAEAGMNWQDQKHQLS